MYTVSITTDAVVDALAAFVAPFLPGVIVQSQINRVASPKPPFCLLTPVTIQNLSTTLGTTLVTYQASQQTIITPVKIGIQIDFYGVNSADYCRAIVGLFRSEYAATQFSDGIKPLYCDDGHQTRFITSESQYEQRWIMMAYLQYNASIDVPVQTANEITYTFNGIN